MQHFDRAGTCNPQVQAPEDRPAGLHSWHYCTGPAVSGDHLLAEVTNGCSAVAIRLPGRLQELCTPTLCTLQLCTRVKQLLPCCVFCCKTHPACSFAATPVDTNTPAPTIMPTPSMATWNQLSTCRSNAGVGGKGCGHTHVVFVSCIAAQAPCLPLLRQQRVFSVPCQASMSASSHPHHRMNSLLTWQHTHATSVHCTGLTLAIS